MISDSQRYSSNNVPTMSLRFSILPSGNDSRSYRTSPFSTGKSTISMAIFRSYVCLPEGIPIVRKRPKKKPPIKAHRPVAVVKVAPRLVAAADGLAWQAKLRMDPKENHGKIIGKPWETVGKWWLNGILWGFTLWCLQTWQWKIPSEWEVSIWKVTYKSWFF